MEYSKLNEVKVETFYICKLTSTIEMSIMTKIARVPAMLYDLST